MRFKKGFIKEFEQTLEEKRRQDELRKKYEVDGNTIIVEKNNILKTFMSLSGVLIRIVASTILAVLAGIGLIALFYDDIRNELLAMLLNFWEDMI